MLLDAGFVPAVLEGFEGTLDEVRACRLSEARCQFWLNCKPGSRRSEFR
jgi:hypothetical protein